MKVDGPTLAEVLESAARLQQVVPDAVLVGGSAAAFYASHRVSFDHDHVLADLGQRFDDVLEAIERTDGWVTNHVVPYKIILGELGDIEAGVRQLIRARPLEVIEVTLPSGRSLRVPTIEEILRIKGYLIVTRNQTRDFVDVAALTESTGLTAAASVLARIDDYYDAQRAGGLAVASQLVRQLAEPKPKDSRTVRELKHYKNLEERWHEWSAVTDQCRELARSILVSRSRSGTAGKDAGT